MVRGKRRRWSLLSEPLPDSVALIGTVRDHTSTGHKDAVIETKRVAKDLGKDAEVLHLGERVLDDDADAGEESIVQFLLRRERKVPDDLIGQRHTALRHIILQPLEATVGHQREVRWDLLQSATVAQQRQIMLRPRHGGTDIAQTAVFVDDEQRLARVRLLLPQI